MISLKKIILLLAFLYSILLITGCSSSYPRFTSEDYEKNSIEQKNEDDVIVENKIERLKKDEMNPKLDGQRMMDIINKRIGTPYEYGGKDEDGFDCSGFTAYVYEKSAKIRIGPSSVDQYKIGRKIDRGELIFGDLVFFNTTGRIPSHVGIYVGDGRFAHSSTQKGVIVSSLSSTYYKRRFVGARRLFFD